MNVRRDVTTSGYIFEIPAQVFDGIPTRVYEQIIDVLSETFIKTYKKEIIAGLDREEIAEKVLDLIAHKLGVSAGDKVKKALDAI